MNLRDEGWTKEDVEHLDVLIATEIERSGAIALPGAEHARNKIAAKVGIPVPAQEGGITWESIRETDYN